MENNQILKLHWKINFWAELLPLFHEKKAFSEKSKEQTLQFLAQYINKTQSTVLRPQQSGVI